MKLNSPFHPSVLALLVGMAATTVFALESPTEFDWVSDSESSVIFSWTNIDQETRTEIDVLQSADSWFNIGYAKPGIGTLRIINLAIGTPASYRFRAVTVDDDERVTDSSPHTEAVEVITRDDLYIADNTCVLRPPGQFNYPLQLQGFTSDQIGVAGVPETITFVDSPDRIVGTIESGSYTMLISGQDGRHKRTVKLEIIITEAPLIAMPIEDFSATTTTAAAVIDLNGVFNDPDTETIVRMETVVGNIDIALSDGAAPLTVANFLSYVDRGAWDGTFFHNSVANSFSILQAGQFFPRDDEKIQRVSLDPSISNAFDASRPNVCGTIAMLKPTGDSSTNQWLFNFDDNSEALDNWYGAFGRVMGNGMTVINTIAALPSSDHVVDLVTCEGTLPDDVCGESESFRIKDWPLLRLRENELNTDDFVTITRVARISPLAFALTSNSSPGVATASISDSGELTIDYLATGTTTMSVTATDLDGATTTHSFTVSVGQSFEAWAEAAGLVGNQAQLSANPDLDTFNNLLEYAFGGDPRVRDSSTIDATVGRVAGAEAQVPSITFFYRVTAGDLDYVVQLSSDLESDWSSVWTSDQGLDDPRVLRTEDVGDGLMKVTVGVQDAPLPAFLRIQVSSR